ncbi:MAG TPA: recombinase family protein [Clostridia bacterium]|nr:recombinase family protein [Clostridia bacterium]
MSAGNSPGPNGRIAIYARKSKVTEQGSSIEMQIEKCRRYAYYKYDAKDSEIEIYQDEGLSGFYGDRPDFLRMLSDIDAEKIRAVVCYKYDRISRRTSDLSNLVESLIEKKIDFAAASDEISSNTPSGRVLVFVLSAMAEFERNIIAERIGDNMFELAKTGRWLGGNCPTGFRSQKEHFIRSGKKRVYNRLVPVESELDLVKKVFTIYLKERSLTKTAEMINQWGFLTKNNAAFTRRSVRDLIINPVYSAADSSAYRYLKKNGASVYAEQNEFDGSHGLMVYNKTEQTKNRESNSSFSRPKYVKKTVRRNITDWVVAIGEHDSTVTGHDWVKAQNILENNKKAVLSRGKSTALLSGLVFCPYCGSPLYVRAESGRLTSDGRQKFHYVCRKKYLNGSSCDFRNVKGNELDRFVLETICSLPGADQKFFTDLRNHKKSLPLQTGKTDAEILKLRKRQARAEKELRSQTENLRNAPNEIRESIYEDIQAILREQERIQSALGDLQLEQAKNCDLHQAETVFSNFLALAESVGYQDKLELLHNIIDRVTADGDQVEIYFKTV